MLEFFADDPFRWQPKTVAIERKRSFQIVHSSVITEIRGFIFPSGFTDVFL